MLVLISVSFLFCKTFFFVLLQHCPSLWSTSKHTLTSQILNVPVLRVCIYVVIVCGCLFKCFHKHFLLWIIRTFFSNVLFHNVYVSVCFKLTIRYWFSSFLQAVPFPAIDNIHFIFTIWFKSYDIGSYVTSQSITTVIILNGQHLINKQ